MSLHGYVVVMKPGVQDRRYPDYAGLDRLPYWTLDNADALNVEELGLLEDEAGLIQSIEAVQQALEIYSRVYPRSDLEVIYADAGRATDADPESGGLELGYDVAALAPFYSIVTDLPRDETELRSFADQLNERQLFPNRAQAEEFLIAYRAVWRRDPSLEDPEGQRVWRVNLTPLE
jgi:hypothetical protein